MNTEGFGQSAQLDSIIRNRITRIERQLDNCMISEKERDKLMMDLSIQQGMLKEAFEGVFDND